MEPEPGESLSREELDRAFVISGPPGIALKFLGAFWIVTGLAVTMIGLMVAMGAVQGPGDDFGRGITLLLGLAFAAVPGPLTAIAGRVTVRGGTHLRRLGSLQWAADGATAAFTFGVLGGMFWLLAMWTLDVWFLGIPAMITFAGIPVGVWADNATNARIVKAAFR